MKKCSYCGKDYPDDATVCAVDQNPLVTIGQAVAPAAAAAAKPSVPAPAARVVKPALMPQLRSLHLYLGCIFAPMLLLFAITGIWQTFGIKSAGWMAMLSSIHTSHGSKLGTGLTSPLMRIFVLLMALAFVTTTILGIMMAVKYGKNRRAAYYCLGASVIVPLVLVLIRLAMS
jgi:hypothetical protein